MTDANNQINDVLSKLTALGTVLIPMNLVTGASDVCMSHCLFTDTTWAGLWGMNVHVPGEDDKDSFIWFGSIIALLCAFALVGGITTYKFLVGRK